jgi:hypothetical protein
MALALAALREQIGAIDGSRKTEGYSSEWVSAHIPRGALVEIVGAARTELMVHLLAEQQKESSEARALWVEADFSVYPIGLVQKGVELSRLLFVEAPKDSAWVLGQALQAQVFPFLIASDFQFHEKDLRRFQLLSERAHATTFLLSSERRQSWVPQLVLEASPSEEGGEIEVNILRQRYSS